MKCALCSYEGKDLTVHINRTHKMAVSLYKEKHGPVIDLSVFEKRKSTCIAKYGVPHFTNRPAAALSNMIFERGHSLRDPEVRSKGEHTKMEKYGDPNFTNREKAKITSLERYGVEHTCSAPSVICKRIETLKKRYGRVFNVDTPHNKKEIPPDFYAMYRSGEPVEKLAARYSVSEPVISRWVKELNLTRSYTVSTDREVLTPEQIVSNYFDKCDSVGAVLSFYEYGKIVGQKYSLKLKRLFNTGGRFSGLKAHLFAAAENKDNRISFRTIIS